jgi:anti-sigma B factor antagonist
LVSPETQNFRSGPLSLQVESTASRSTLRLRGELDLATADLVRESLGAALAAGRGEVVVDLTELAFIDSTGIAILITAISEADGVLKFVPSKAPAVARVLRLTGVDAKMSCAD